MNAIARKQNFLAVRFTHIIFSKNNRMRAYIIFTQKIAFIYAYQGLTATKCLLILFAVSYTHLYVLGRFAKDEEPVIREALDNAAEACGIIVDDEIRTAMNKFN